MNTDVYTHIPWHTSAQSGRRVIEGGSSGHEDDESEEVNAVPRARAQCSEENTPYFFLEVVEEEEVTTSL